MKNNKLIKALMPACGILVTGLMLTSKVSAQPQAYTIESVQAEQGLNVAKNLLDRDSSDNSRWSAQGFTKNVVIDLGTTKTITGTRMWTYQNRAYQYKIRVSNNPNSGYVTVADKSNNTSAAQPLKTSFNHQGRYVKLVITGANNYSGDWVSINDFEVITKNSGNSLTFLNEARLNLTKTAIAAGNPKFLVAYDDLIELAERELSKDVDPVTNKTLIAPSGDIHDYHTIGAYYWPDPTKRNGLPWIYRDGEFNRDSTGPATDWSRRKNMLESLKILNLAYTLSEDTVYLQKVREIVKTWFVDKDTRMNPNLNYGKSIPGKVDGTNFAVIDWADIAQVLTSVELIEKNNLWGDWAKQRMHDWLSDYYTWLTTNELGIRESTRSNNHGTNYDYQALSLQIFLDKKTAAGKQINVTKSRIRSQINANGGQPEELSRTKSVNYTVNNLWALARIADLSRRHTNNDLWSYTRPDGVSIKTALDFVVPYFKNPDAWKWKQITGGGVASSLENLALPRFTLIQLMLDEKVLPNGLNGNNKLSPLEILTYAPQY